MGVGVVDPTAEAYRMGAVAGGGDLLHPPVIAGPGPSDGLGHNAREQLCHADRLGHATSPGAGIGGTTRSPGACSASSTLGSARSPRLARMMAPT
jgi:hypothetical protein